MGFTAILGKAKATRICDDAISICEQIFSVYLTSAASMRIRFIRSIVTVSLGITRRVLTHTLSVETRPLIGCARSYKHPIRLHDYQYLLSELIIFPTLTRPFLKFHIHKASFTCTINITVFVSDTFDHFDQHFDGLSGCATHFSNQSVHDH